MSEFKIIKYEAKDSLQISGHEVDGVDKRNENNLGGFHNNIKCANIHIIVSWKERIERGDREHIQRHNS